MKRSWLKRGAKQLKRTRIKAKSPRRADEASEADEKRDAYLREHPVCFICIYEVQVLLTASRKPEAASEVHHMAGRNRKRPDLYELPENWCPSCRTHHNMVTDHSKKTAQLVFDAKRFCTPAEAKLAYLKERRPSRFNHVTG